MWRSPDTDAQMEMIDRRIRSNSKADTPLNESILEATKKRPEAIASQSPARDLKHRKMAVSETEN